jgi:hypothetical protein
MLAPENPPGFVVRTEAQKAAWDNGYRLEQGWMRVGSVTPRRRLRAPCGLRARRRMGRGFSRLRIRA